MYILNTVWVKQFCIDVSLTILIACAFRNKITEEKSGFIMVNGKKRDWQSGCNQ